jgi:hypothetical protein
MNQSQLVRTIKAHIAKGDKAKAKDKAEQHYIAAGQYLKQLKDGCPDQKTFLEKVEREIVGGGRKTVAEVRADTAKRRAISKARKAAAAWIALLADTTGEL